MEQPSRKVDPSLLTQKSGKACPDLADGHLEGNHGKPERRSAWRWPGRRSRGNW